MIKGSIQEEDIKIINTYAPNIGAPQYIMNNAINEIKNTLEGTNSRVMEAEDRISEVQDRMVEHT